MSFSVPRNSHFLKMSVPNFVYITNGGVAISFSLGFFAFEVRYGWLYHDVYDLVWYLLYIQFYITLQTEKYFKENLNN